MKRLIYIITLSLLISYSLCAQEKSHSMIKAAHIKSPGGWDGISVNDGKIYVSHSSQVNILDEKTGDSIGVILGTTGVHAIAFDNARGLGFTSNGRLNNVTVFDLKTNKVMAQVPVGQNPDAIMYEPYLKKIITCNGKSNDLTIIDPETNKVTGTISLEAKPEEAVSDGNGKLYVNLEELSEVGVVDLNSMKLIDRWNLVPGESPTGLAIDNKTHRLFSACSDNKYLIVLDAGNGRKVAKLPIGDRCDGVAFDQGEGLIYASCGEGVITVIREVSADDFKVIETITTKPGARTIALDENTHTLFLPTAEFEPLGPNDSPKARRNMKPGTFQVLVVQ
jgi:YVTN family beta-propeller protein